MPVVKKYDCIANHKIELTEKNVNDFNISLNPENIELIHFKCHNMNHKRFGYEGLKEVFIVYGSPCSGKTTFVKENAETNDLIIDMDSIWQCISNNPRYIKPDRLKQNVFMVRDTLIDMVAKRIGKWAKAYVIAGYPYVVERNRMADKLNASLIFIDESKEVCLQRAALRGTNHVQYVEEWFAKYQCE